MDHEELLALVDERMRRGARPESPAARVEHIGGVVRQSGPDSVWNGVLWSDLGTDTDTDTDTDTGPDTGPDTRTDGGARPADRVIAEQIAYFTALGQDFEWTLYGHDRPADLGDRLLAAGFTPDEPETLMVAEVAALLAGPAGTAAPGDAGITLREVTDEAGVDEVVDVHEQAFGTDGSRLRRRILAHLAESPDTLRVHLALAEVDGREVPVSAARMELHPGTGFAGLWGGGTVEAWRGRGVYRALVAHRARLADELGYEYLRVDASPQSRPILERLGFAALTTATPYHYGG
ncbi:GNAT family N-acetyltransferase [Kitasatospora sp. NBC_00458]|uniref:GNAT family N-acetyltransferase n=1 Tax=Kitasatospora sp. NBC_00458 TaxID=2903568 RepID=UPI002E18941D